MKITIKREQRQAGLTLPSVSNSRAAKRNFFYLFAVAALVSTGCDQTGTDTNETAPADIRLTSAADYEINHEANMLALNATAAAPFGCKVTEGLAWLSLESEPGLEHEDGRTPVALWDDENPSGPRVYRLSKRIVVGENTGATRTGKIIVYRDSENAAITVTIKQWANGAQPAYIKPDLSSWTFGADTGWINFFVDTNVEYTVSVEADAQGWLSVKPGAGRTEDEEGNQYPGEVIPDWYEISVTANETGERRAGYIVLRGVDTGVEARIAIGQDAATGNGGGGDDFEKLFEFSEGLSVEFTSEGGDFTETITLLKPDLEFSLEVRQWENGEITGDGKDWLFVEISGEGDTRTVTVRVRENLDGKPREGAYIIVARTPDYGFAQSVYRSVYQSIVLNR